MILTAISPGQPPATRRTRHIIPMSWLLLCLTLFAPACHAFQGIFAFLKYDRENWMEMASMKEWQTYTDKVVDAAARYGFTGLVIPPTAPVSDKYDHGQQQHLVWMRDKQLYLLDRLHAKGMQAILVPGNPGSLRWARAGRQYPFHSVYTHPSVVAFKHGDEIKDEMHLNKIEKGYRILRSAYPDTPIITVLIGESIGGITGMASGMMQPDRMPTYSDWWKRLGTEICTVRNYWLRSRKNRKSGQLGDYDLRNPYIPQKLAVHPEKMAQLVKDKCPGEAWAFVGQGFGKCAERGKECYWRFPTATEMIEQAELAHRYGAKWFIVFSLTPAKNNLLALLDATLNPVSAHDGSYPVEAIMTIRKRFLDED